MRVTTTVSSSRIFVTLIDDKDNYKTSTTSIRSYNNVIVMLYIVVSVLKFYLKKFANCF